MKRPGINMPASKPPAHQGFHTEKAPRSEVNYRLILEKEFLISERATDIRLEARAFVQHVLHFAA